MRAAIAACWIVALVASACAPVTERSHADREPGEGYASAGDVVLRVNREDDLPNVFGKADIWGRARNRGFVEIRFMGLNAAGLPVFRRRDVEIITNESTMSRTAGLSVYSANGNASQVGGLGNAAFSANGTTIIPAQAQIAALPPDTIEIVVDPAQGRIITVGKNGIEVLVATSSGVRYRAF